MTAVERVGKRSKPDDDGLTVHVTTRGGFDERELLRSRATQEVMTKMASKGKE